MYLSDNQVVEIETLRTNAAQIAANVLLIAGGNPPVLPGNSFGPHEKKATFLSQGDVINNGLLCTTPFGKRLDVEVFSLINRLPFCPPNLAAHLNANTYTHEPCTVAGFPLAITSKLRLLFLDENDLKDY